MSKEAGDPQAVQKDIQLMMCPGYAIGRVFCHYRFNIPDYHIATYSHVVADKKDLPTNATNVEWFEEGQPVFNSDYSDSEAVHAHDSLNYSGGIPFVWVPKKK